MVVGWDWFVGSDKKANNKTICCVILVMNNQLFVMIKQWMVVARERHDVFNSAWNKKIRQNRERPVEENKVQSDANNNILYIEFYVVYNFAYPLWRI